MPREDWRDPPKELDQAVEAQAGAIWLLAAAGALIGVAALDLVGRLAPHYRLSSTRGQIADLIGELLIGAITVAACRPVARRNGGWSSAFGIAVPRPLDIAPGLTWFLFQEVVSRVALIAFVVCIPPSDYRLIATNLTGRAALTPAAAIVLGVTAVVVAPIAEELLMRGLVLRATLTQLSFWPAATLNGILFGLLHVHEGKTVISAAAIGIVTGVFGFFQCVLVRRTARLSPAMYVHALYNGLAIILALRITHTI